MRKIEEIYKKYFQTPVEYSDKWQEELFKKIHNKKSFKILEYKSLKFAVLFAVIFLVIFSSGLFFNYYKITQQKKFIKEFLLSTDAYNFVLYNNIGLILQNYIISEYAELEYENLKPYIQDSLYIYANFSLQDINKKFLSPEIIDELATKYIESLTNKNNII